MRHSTRLCLSSVQTIASLALFAGISISVSNEVIVKDFAVIGVAAGVWMVIIVFLPLLPPDSAGFGELFGSNKLYAVTLVGNGITSISIGIGVTIIEPVGVAGTVCSIAAMAPLCAVPVLTAATWGRGLSPGSNPRSTSG